MTRTELNERILAAHAEWSESLKAVDIAAEDLRKAQDWRDSTLATLRQLARIDEMRSES